MKVAIYRLSMEYKSCIWTYWSVPPMAQPLLSSLGEMPHSRWMLSSLAAIAMLLKGNSSHLSHCYWYILPSTCNNTGENCLADLHSNCSLLKKMPHNATHYHQWIIHRLQGTWHKLDWGKLIASYDLLSTSHTTMCALTMACMFGLRASWSSTCTWLSIGWWKLWVWAWIHSTQC